MTKWISHQRPFESSHMNPKETLNRLLLSIVWISVKAMIKIAGSDCSYCGESIVTIPTFFLLSRSYSNNNFYGDCQIISRCKGKKLCLNHQVSFPTTLIPPLVWQTWKLSCVSWFFFPSLFFFCQTFSEAAKAAVGEVKTLSYTHAYYLLSGRYFAKKLVTFAIKFFLFPAVLTSIGSINFNENNWNWLRSKWRKYQEERKITFMKGMKLFLFPYSYRWY